MASPYYVSPEQVMKDKAEFAMSGIAKARSTVVITYDAGILMVADNPSASLYKLSEIYDNIGFAGAGRYNEFESLRKAGIRHADLKGYSYSRDDVTAKELANNYSQLLGTIFSQDTKPYEVEILVIGTGGSSGQDEIFKISFDGLIIDENGFAAIGGDIEPITKYLDNHHQENMTFKDAYSTAKAALATAPDTVSNNNMEVAVLERARPGRKFKRLTEEELADRLA